MQVKADRIRYDGDHATVSVSIVASDDPKAAMKMLYNCDAIRMAGRSCHRNPPAVPLHPCRPTIRPHQGCHLDIPLLSNPARDFLRGIRHWTAGSSRQDSKRNGLMQHDLSNALFEEAQRVSPAA